MPSRFYFGELHFLKFGNFEKTEMGKVMNIFKTISGNLKKIALAAFAVSAFALPANAAWIGSGYSGFKDTDASTAGIQGINNTSNVPQYNVGNSVVNFAVYQYNGAGSWSGNGVGGLNVAGAVQTLAGSAVTGPTYVYMYEVSDIGLAGLNSLKVQFGGSITSAGYLKSTVFNDAGGTVAGNVGSPVAINLPTKQVPQNLFLGNGTSVAINPGNTPGAGTSNAGLPVFSAADPGGVPHSTVLYNGYGANGVASPSSPLTSGAGSVGITASVIQGSGTTLGAATFNLGIGPNAFSSVVFITSTVKPNEIDGIVNNGKYTPSGVNQTFNTYNGLLAPAPVPVPASLALVLSGLPGLLGFRWLSKRFGANAE